MFEERPKLLDPNEIEEDTAQSIYDTYSGKIQIEFPNPVNNQKYVLRSRGLIGYIPIDEKTTIQINPKVEIKNIFRMLEYAYRINALKFLKSGDTEVESIQDLYENLASRLADQVLDRNRKGLFRDYKLKNEILPVVKGRIKILPTTIALLRGAPRIHVDYEEHTANLEDNQILLWTLYQLRRFEIKRTEVLRKIRKAYREVLSKVDVKQIDPRLCINRLYHRRNQDYQHMHDLCRFFLEQRGPGLNTGEHHFLPFTINMPDLFEKFLAVWLSENIPRAQSPLNK